MNCVQLQGFPIDFQHGINEYQLRLDVQRFLLACELYCIIYLRGSFIWVSLVRRYFFGVSSEAQEYWVRRMVCKFSHKDNSICYTTIYGTARKLTINVWFGFKKQ